MEKILSTLFLLVLSAPILSAQDVKPEILGSKKTLERLVSEKFSEVPKEVMDFHARGTISVLLLVDNSGNVSNLKMLGGFSHINFMKEFITKEISSWKFRPLMKNGKRVPFRGLVAIPFCYGSFRPCW